MQVATERTVELVCSIQCVIAEPIEEARQSGDGARALFGVTELLTNIDFTGARALATRICLRAARRASTPVEALRSD